MTETTHELVTVQKAGEPTLRISRHALPEHTKLGWKHVEDVVNRFIAPAQDVGDEDLKAAKKDGEKDPKGDDKKNGAKK